MLSDAEKLARGAEFIHLAGHFPFAGPTTFMRFPSTREVHGCEAAVLGVPLDLGTYHRSGQRFGPRALREMSLMILTELCPADHYRQRQVADCGDCWFAPGDLDHAHAQIQAEAQRIVEAGPRLLTLGGDHSLSLPLLRAHHARYGPLCLVHFDSHADVWDSWPKPYHGAPFALALREGLLDAEHSLQLGLRTSGCEATPLPHRDADWVVDHRPAEVAAEIREAAGDRPVYLTFDIDFLDPAYAPGTGTPVVGGPTTNHAVRILRELKGLQVMGADVVELCPPYDSPGQPTALAAATVAFLLMELLLADR